MSLSNLKNCPIPATNAGIALLEKHLETKSPYSMTIIVFPDGEYETAAGVSRQRFQDKYWKYLDWRSLKPNHAYNFICVPAKANSKAQYPIAAVAEIVNDDYEELKRDASAMTRRFYRMCAEDPASYVECALSYEEPEHPDDTLVQVAEGVFLTMDLMKRIKGA